MSKYYVAGIPFDSENSLQHYGVKNMEWGKHKFGLDADPRYIKWLKDAGMNIGKFANQAAQKVGQAASSAAKATGTAVNRGANFVTGNQNRQTYQNAQRASQYSRNPQRAQQNARTAYNQAQSKTLPGITTATVKKAGQAASTAAKNAQNWAGQQARNVGNAVQNAASNVDQRLNITGNKDREDAEKFRKYANQAQSQVSKDYWNKKAAESDAKANSSLASKASTTAQNVGNAVGNAAKTAGDWAGQQARNVGNAVANSTPVKEAGKWVDQNITGNTNRAAAQGFQQVADNLTTDPTQKKAWEAKAQSAKQQADNSLFGRVGNAASAVGNAAQQAGNWAGQAARDVGNAAQQAGNWVGDRAADVGNFFSNADEKSAAERAEQAAQNREMLAIGRSGYALPTPDGGEDQYIGRLRDAMDVDSAYREADAARAAYENHPLTRMQNAAQNAGQWLGDRAADVGNAVGNAAQGAGNWVDQKLNLTGNQNTAEADRYRNLANQATSQVSKDYWNNKVAEAQQDARDNSLLGRIGNAANNVGNWVGDRASDVGNAASNVAGGAKGFINSAGQWVSNTAGNVGKAAQRVAKKAESGAKGFINSAGQWVSNAAGNVKNAAQNAGQAVGNAANTAGDWAKNAAQDAKNFVDYRVTGAGYNQVSPDNPEIQEAFKDISKSNPSELSVDSRMTGFSTDPRMVYSPQEAMQYMQEVADQGRANSLFGRIGNAANAAGQWVGDRASDVGNFAGQTAGNVGQWVGDRAADVGNAARGAGNWAGQAARDVGNWAGQTAGNVGNALGTAAIGARDWGQGAIQDAGRWINGVFHPYDPRQRIPQRYVFHSAIDEKPEGVSDAFWEKFVADGGTREEYERDWR